MAADADLERVAQRFSKQLVAALEPLKQEVVEHRHETQMLAMSLNQMLMRNALDIFPGSCVPRPVSTSGTAPSLGPPDGQRTPQHAAEGREESSATEQQQQPRMAAEGLQSERSTSVEAAEKALHMLEQAEKGRGLLVADLIGLGQFSGSRQSVADDIMESHRRGHMELFSQHSTLVMIVDHWVFQQIVGLLILANALMMGIIGDIDTRTALKGEDSGISSWTGPLELFFTTGFTIELTLRLIAHNINFFYMDGWAWNLFDLGLVFTSLLEKVVNSMNISFARALRVLRMARVLRVVRLVKFLRELRIMIHSVLCCGPSLFWAFCLIFFSVYLFAVFLQEVSRDYLRGELEKGPLDRDSIVVQGIEEYFNGLLQSMFFMFVGMMGGISWYEIARPINEMNWIYGCLFLAFVIFVLLALLNVLTGIFVASTESNTWMDNDLVVQAELAAQDSEMNQMKHFFLDLDQDKSMTIGYQELLDNMHEPKVRAYFRSMEMDRNQACSLFKLLDVEGRGEIGVDDFIVGCLRLKGTAKSIDIASMLCEQRALALKLDQLQKILQSMQRHLWPQAERPMRGTKPPLLHAQQPSSYLPGSGRDGHKSTRDPLSMDASVAPEPQVAGAQTQWLAEHDRTCSV